MRVFLACGLRTACWVAVAFLSLAALPLASRPAAAPVAMAQKTGKSCNVCHTTPPALNSTGEAYKATGKLPSEGPPK